MTRNPPEKKKRSQSLSPTQEPKKSFFRRDIGCIPIIVGFFLVLCGVIAAVPSIPTPTPTITPTPSITLTPTITYTPSITFTPSITPAISDTPAPQPSPSDPAAIIESDLATLTSLPQIDSVDYDDSSNLREVTISYLSTAKTQQQINDEWMILIDNVASVLSAHQIHPDIVTLDSRTADPSVGGSKLSLLYVHIMHYVDKELTRAQLLNKVEYTAHNPTPTRDVESTSEARRETQQSKAETQQARYDNLTATAESRSQNSVPLIAPTPVPFSQPADSCPRNCNECVAKGWTAEQCAQCPNLDRDHDGLACYGE